MKKTYVSPKIGIEEFAPNEYVAACTGIANAKFLVPCRNGGDQAAAHGFIVDEDDYYWINQYKSGYEKEKDNNKQFDVYNCNYPGCKQSIDPNQDRKLGDAISMNDASGYAWIDIIYAGSASNNDPDTALFHTTGSYISNS